MRTGTKTETSLYNDERKARVKIWKQQLSKEQQMKSSCNSSAGGRELGHYFQRLCNLFQMCQMLHIFLAISCELGLEQLALWFRDTWPALLCVLGVRGEKLQYHSEVDCKQILYECK